MFAKVEHVLRRSEYVRPNRQKAEVDWLKFAEYLGDPFFAHVRKSISAGSLMSEPPRAYYREDGWQPTNPVPIKNVVDLFLHGVCQVRNNIVHGEKFVEVESPRSDALVAEAQWVLAEAIEWHPKVKKIFSELNSTG